MKMKKSTKLMLLFAFLGLGVITALGGVYFLGLQQWKNFDPSVITNANQTLLVYDAQDVLISGVYSKENRRNTQLANISPNVINALLATEDMRFYEHFGIDITRIIGALIADIKSGSLVQGASTITQQLVKLSHLTNEKTWTRKIQEALLAIQMEKHFTKDQILEMYLNYVYFGGGAYGIEAAAEYYFAKSAKELSISEGALLVGILKAPSNYAPHIDMKASKTRRNLVIHNMQQNSFITPEQAQSAKQEEVTLQLSDRFDYPHGFYMELAMQEARQTLNISQEELISGGYRIYTALQSDMQSYAEELFLDETLFPLDVDGEKVQGALVVIDPKTYEIVTLLGGREHEVKLGFNRASQLRRQPGSAIKPIIAYAPAMEQFGYTAATMLLDEPTNFNGYTPRNFGEKYNGFVTLRTAVAKSLNVPAVKVLNDIGVTMGKSYAQSVGINFEEQDNSLTLALGGFTQGVTPLELCAAYVPFANGGKFSTPYTIRKITDASGKIIYRAQTQETQALSPANAFILTSMMQSTVTDGTAKRLNIGIPLAAKTGTTGLRETGGNKDAWVMAYNPDYVAALWLGFDNTTAVRALPNDVTGGTYPAALLARLFSYRYENQTAPGFTRPIGVRSVRLDAKSLQSSGQAKLASGFTPQSSVQMEYFTDATVPIARSDYWVMPKAAGQITVQAGEKGLPVITFLPKESIMMYRLYRQYGMDVQLLAEYSGGRGEIVHTDTTAQYGLNYTYYIVPVHPELTSNNIELKGQPSSRVSFRAVEPTMEEFDYMQSVFDRREAQALQDLQDDAKAVRQEE